jgi:hypothetical protein
MNEQKHEDNTYVCLHMDLQRVRVREMPRF